MKEGMAFLLALLILVLPGYSGAQADIGLGREKQNGITYVGFGPECYSNLDSDISLHDLALTGATWISLVVQWYQDNIGSTIISPSPMTPIDASLIHAIGQAHSLGLKVMLKPHVELLRDPTHWKGDIGKNFTTVAEWDQWFASYRAFIDHFAGLATAYGVDQFCVGCELEGTTQRAAAWRVVVADVRSRYTGRLTYASFEGGEETRISWWDALDFIGVDAYYPLSTKPDPKLTELKATWKLYISSLASLSAKWRKPILFTEIGYRSIAGTSMNPGDWQIQGRLDLQEQANCYEAAFESVYKLPWFAGLFWWCWSPNPTVGGRTDKTYSPHNKPAEQILMTWFGSLQLRPVSEARRSTGKPKSSPVRQHAVH
jgi:Glycoside Hydrolase Family 113